MLDPNVRIGLIYGGLYLRQANIRDLMVSSKQCFEVPSQLYLLQYTEMLYALDAAAPPEKKTKIAEVKATCYVLSPLSVTES